MRRWWAVLLLAVALRAETPGQLLRRVQQRVVENVDRLPRYTCRQEVTRAYHEAAGPLPRKRNCDDTLATLRGNTASLGRLMAEDRLRLDVAVSQGEEIHSWAGADRFASRGLSAIVGAGPVGTGDFGSFTISLFVQGSAQFHLEGERTVNGRRLMEYGYRVPRSTSRYTVRAGQGSAVTGYSGLIWVDPKTASLVRLVVRTDELPEASGLCAADSTIDYQQARIGQADFLLPRETRLRMIGLQGAQWSENVVRYSGCREWLAESSVRFDESPSTGAEPATPFSEPLPPGLAVKAQLDAAIDLTTAAAGDPIRAVVTSPVRDKAGREWVPAGAVLEGRLVRVEQRHQPQRLMNVGLRFHLLRSGAERRPFHADAEMKEELPRGGSGLRQRGMTLGPPTGGVCALRVQGQPVLRKGHETTWVTTAPRDGDELSP